MNSIFDTDDLGDDPFEPKATPAKKRGRPAGAATAAKPKPKTAKPKFNVPRFKENLVDSLMGVALELTAPGATHAEKMRVAADLLELIEKAKA